MYEDSQRFSEEEGDESSHVVSINPRSLIAPGRDETNRRIDDFESRVFPAHMMQRGVERDSPPPFAGAGRDVETPKYGELSTDIREESLQRILSRLSPNGQRAFLKTLSEGDADVRVPLPFSIPETDNEDECSELGELRDDRSEIDHLLDSPIPELTTKSLIPPPEGESIQSRLLLSAHPNVTSRVSKVNTKVHTDPKTIKEPFCSERSFNPSASYTTVGRLDEDIQLSQRNIRPRPFQPLEADKIRVQKNLFPEARVRDVEREGLFTGHSRIHVPASTNLVWVNRGLIPVCNETGPFRSTISKGVGDSDRTYPKLLTGVEMFGSIRSPVNAETEMFYAERTGVGHPMIPSEGTTMYQNLGPIEDESRPEANLIQPRWGNLGNEGHGVVPIKGHADPLGGGNPRHITRPGPQFFRGSGGDMLEKFGSRFMRPTPSEQYRGAPLDDMRPPRPPHLSKQAGLACNCCTFCAV